MVLVRLLDNTDREGWENAFAELKDIIRDLPKDMREQIWADKDVEDRARDLSSDCSDKAFADFVLAVDFSRVKYSDSAPRTYRLT